MPLNESFFPPMPKTGIMFPSTILLQEGLEYTKKHTSPSIVNHCLRSASFALLLSRRHPTLIELTVDMELIIYSALMHDLGWATTKELVSSDKRFEVDGANVARKFLLDSSSDTSDWDKRRIQLSWDAIALHTIPSIAYHKEPEVAAVALGIAADFRSRDAPLKELISDEEHKEIVQTFPRLQFKEEFLSIMCGLCRDKPETTMDNLVSSYGCVYGLDGKGTGKEEFFERVSKNWSANRTFQALANCAACE